MKGISTELILIILAVVVGIALIVIFWGRGINPLEFQSRQSECETKVNEMCNAGTYNTQTIPSYCPAYFKNYGKDTDLQSCLNSGSVSSSECQNFCRWYKEERVRVS